MFSSPQLSMTDAIVTAIQSILLPQDENLSPLQVPLPVTDDGSSLGNQICRVVAELETRACIVLALYLQDIEFTREFIQHCGSSIDMLKSLAKDCSTGTGKGNKCSKILNSFHINPFTALPRAVLMVKITSYTPLPQAPLGVITQHIQSRIMVSGRTLNYHNLF